MDSKMINIINSITIGIMALLLYSCSQQKQDKSCRVRLRSSIETTLKMYIQENPEYDSFLLLTETYELAKYSNDRIKRVVIGPAYKGLYNSGESSYMSYPSMYACINHRIIFIQSSSDFIIQNNKIDFYTSKEQKTHDAKSEFPIEYYMKRAITFLYDIRNDSIYDISRRADTLIFKQKVEFIPPQLE